MRRRQRDRQRRARRRLPPVELLDTAQAGGSHQPGVPERCDHDRVAGRCQPAQRRPIAVIVVIVAEQDHRDRRRILEPDRRLTHAPRPE